MGDVCKGHCTYPCHRTNADIFGSEIYTYDSRICKSATHDLRISLWNVSARDFILKRIPYNRDYDGMVRFGFSSKPFGTLNYKNQGSFVFSNPRISEELLDVVSLHGNYLYGEGEDHQQICLIASDNKLHTVLFNSYLNESTEDQNGQKIKEDRGEYREFSLLWPESLFAVSGGGYQCTPEATMLSIPTSLAMRKDADFLPPSLTFTANVNETVTLNMTKASNEPNQFKWFKDSRDIVEATVTMQGTKLLLKNVRIGSSGIYSLQYSTVAGIATRGITRLIVRACPEGKFGDQCTGVCPPCANGGICHDFVGTCVCPPGFNGTFCDQACEPGYLGKDCTLECAIEESSLKNMSCRNFLVCLPDPYGCSCSAGFKGLSCNVSCDPGEYGAGCMQLRDCHCANDLPCDIFSGGCPTGCHEGWHGTYCNISYPVFKKPPIVSEVGEDFVVLNFSAWNALQDDGIGIPISYRVLYKKTKEQESWKLGPLVPATDESQYSVMISYISPGSTYFFAIAVVDDESRKSQKENVTAKIVHTLCSKPKATPDNVHINTTDNVVNVNWELPEVKLWNCDSVVSTLKYSSKHYSNEVQLLNTSYNFLSPPFTKWQVRICLSPPEAKNSQYSCTRQYNITTNEGTPGPVDNIRHKVIAARYATLAWSAPAVVNGIIRKYVVEYHQTKWIHPCSLPIRSAVLVTTTTNSWFFVLNDLLPSSVYSVDISAFTVAQGPAKTIELQTVGTVPDGVPVNLKFSEERKELSWDPPLCNVSNGIVDSYFVVTSGLDSYAMSHYDATVSVTNITVRGLLQFTRYRFTVWAINEYGQSKKFSSLLFQTSPTAPLAVSDVFVSVVSETALYISWSPPYPPQGNLSYYVLQYSSDNDTYSERILFPLSEVKCSKSFEVKRHCYVLSDLESNTFYKLRIRAFNLGVHQAGSIAFATGKTVESVPEAPTSLAFTNRNDKGIEVHWEDPAFTNGQITKYRVNITLLENTEMRKYSFSSSVELEASAIAYITPDLLPFSSYSLCIEATTKVGYGPSLCQNFNTSISVPELKKPPELVKISDGMVFIKIMPGRITQTPITAYYVVVEPWEKESWRTKHVTDIPFERQNCAGRSGNVNKTYVALMTEKVPLEGLVVTLGNGSCQNGYYNAVLKPHSVYLIGLVAVSRHGDEKKYSRVKYMSEAIVVDKPYERNPAGSIVLGISLLFLCVIAVIFMLIDMKKFPFLMFSKRLGGLKLRILPKIEESDCTINEGMEDEMDQIDTESLNVDLSNPIPVEELGIYMKDNIANGAIKREYKSLRKGQRYPCTAAKIPENKLKNRYGNLLPYDHSRVHLDKIAGINHSDYINANYISGYRDQQKYIATQGPKSDTLNDFWRMIWQENTCKILMLTNLIENGRPKCEKYWTDDAVDDSELYGNLKLTFLHCEPFSDFCIRTFSLYETEEKETREVKLFHFQSWPDHGLPAVVCPVIVFLRKAQEYKKDSKSPIVVHCSAGIGRTGTVILLNEMLEMAHDEGNVDFLRYLKSMRADRPNMVENVDQYIFTYKALAETFNGLTTCIPCSSFDEKVQSLHKPEGECEETVLEKEFHMLLKQKPSFFYMETRSACLPENKDKNRSPDILAIDRARPILQHCTEDGSNYINAVYVNGYGTKDAYLATQYPLPNTIRDFWCMIYETKSRTIVLLNQIDFSHGSCPQSWPTEIGELLTFGEFQIRCMSSDSQESLQSWTLLLSFQQGTGEQPLPLIILQCCDWSSAESLPNDDMLLLSLFDRCDERQEKIGQHVITVQCLDGVRACGIFCAIMFVFEKMKREQFVDIFHTVNSIRANRCEFIENLVQYEFLYNIVAKYLNLSEIYSNLK